MILYVTSSMECCGGKTNSGIGELINNLGANSLVYTNTGNDLVSVPTGLNGQVLVQGSGSVGWVTLSGTGTVTSVGISVPSYLTVGGSPITGAGTITISSVAGSEGQVLTSTGGVVGWQNLPAVNWASPGAIGSTTANTGTFTTLQNNGMIKSIITTTTIAYVSGSITFTAANFSTGRIRFTGVALATTITTDTAVNLVTQFGSVVGSTFVGDFTYVSTGAPRLITWNGGTGVTMYSTNAGNNQFYQQWVIVITSSTTVDFYIQ